MADALKRGPGRPRKAAGEKSREVRATLPPDLHDAYRASGRTIAELVRAGLSTLDA